MTFRKVMLVVSMPDLEEGEAQCAKFSAPSQEILAIRFFSNLTSQRSLEDFTVNIFKHHQQHFTLRKLRV
jgi:hypothetical protein